MARQLAGGYVLDLRAGAGEREHGAARGRGAGRSRGAGRNRGAGQGRGSARQGSPAQAVPSVLIVSRLADAERDAVARMLASVAVPVTRLDAESAPDGGMAIDLEHRAVLIGQQWIMPTVTWIRHFSVRAMPRKRGAVRQAFAADSWQAAIDQLSVVSTRAITSRDRGLLEQLMLARNHGIAIPRTVVTTDPAAARHLLGSQRVVIKALDRHFVEASPGLLTGVFPEILGESELCRASMPPVAMQEYVEHDTEIRSYYVAGDVAAAFEITKPDPAAPWLDADQVIAAQIEAPPAVAEATRTLAAAMGAEHAALDFLIAGGTPVFLEANLAGDWCWLESRAGVEPVTNAMARALAESHRQVATLIPGHGLDLIAFLSGSAGNTGVDKGERSL
ncbi:MAG TPA: hypothetical protein VFQ44_04785 [Streptosporangiaceae bacterium]|nr:hypothetical protein [Streptosporangiaceae bacterium]